MRLWDTKTGQIRTTLQGAGLVHSVAFSPDGCTLATGSESLDPNGQSSTGEVRLWDAKTGQIRTTLTGHRGGVNAVAFSPDGLTLASAGDWMVPHRTLQM